MRNQIFLAHGTSTATEAEQLSAELRKQGADVFSARGSLTPGDNWVEAIDRALDESNAYVFLVRASEDPSERLRAEWRKAARQAARRPETKIVPLVVGGGQPPPFLRLWQAMPMSQDIAETSRRILSIVQQPGSNETPADSPEMRPLVENWRRRLEEVERSALAMTAANQELESVE